MHFSNVSCFRLDLALTFDKCFSEAMCWKTVALCIVHIEQSVRKE